MMIANDLNPVLSPEISAMADTLKREGYCDYTCCHQMQASFCGMHALFKEDVLVALKTHDLHLSIQAGTLCFEKGDMQILKLWAQRLMRFSNSRIKTHSIEQSPIAA